MNSRIFTRALLVSASLAVMATAAHAGAFGIREQSAYSQGASFAGNGACGDSIQGTYWNSAAITCLNGRNSEGSLSIIIPDVDVTALPGSTLFGTHPNPGQVGKVGAVPSSTFNWQINDRLFLGMTTNGPYGLANEAQPPQAGQLYFTEGEIFSLNFNPVVGYKISDYVSVGFGVAAQFFDLKNFSRAAGVGPAPTIATLEGDDWGFGFTAGIMFTPSERTSFGIGYRSQIKHTLEGTAQINGLPVAPISAPLTTPDLVTFSFRHMIDPVWTIMGTVEWTNWSDIGTVPVTNTATGTPLNLGAGAVTLPLNYEDGWFFSLGAEYKWTEQTTLRFGIGYELSPIELTTRNLSLPDDDRLWLSGGFTYEASERLSLSGAFTWITMTTDIAVGPGNSWFNAGTGLFFGDVDADVFILSAGFKYKFGHLDDPIVTKY